MVDHDKLIIERMQSGDIPAVLELEAGTPGAWSRGHLVDELRQATGFQFVIRDKAAGKVLAFVCCRIVAGEAEILKLNVVEDARLKGLGYRLLDFALRHCKANGVENCFLELRSSNFAARKLYEKRGFYKIGYRRDYYREPSEDAILMQLQL